MLRSSVIEQYLGRLERRLPASAWRLRVLAEVEDHLRSGAEQAAAELGREEAERRAVERFGPAESLARELALDHAAGVLRRASLLHALVFLALGGGSLLTFGTARGAWWR